MALISYIPPRSHPLVQRFAADVVGPKVREMDEKEMMDPSIISALFEQGVRVFLPTLSPSVRARTH